jgi:hypothetical protein
VIHSDGFDDVRWVVCRARGLGTACITGGGITTGPMLPCRNSGLGGGFPGTILCLETHARWMSIAPKIYHAGIDYYQIPQCADITVSTSLIAYCQMN